MTSHLEEGRLQELIDGEIPSSELAPIQTHLAQCAECRARLDEARSVAEEAQVLIEAIEVTERPATAPSRAPRTARPNPMIRNLAWAATVVIAAGTGYMARGTAPGLPARDAAATALQDQAAPAPQVVAAESAAAEREGFRPEPSAKASVPAPARDRRATDETRTADGPKEEKQSATLQKRLARQEESDSQRAKTRSTEVAALNETVVTSAAPESPRAAAPPPATRGAAPLQQRAVPGALASGTANRLDDATVGARRPPVEITFPAAVNHLDGKFRQIEGLVPSRIELLDGRVRVVYPLANGELVLSQWMENGALVFRLTAPDGFPADSLARLRARVRD